MWIKVTDRLPTPSDCFDGEVIGWVAPYSIESMGYPVKVTYYEGEWYQDWRTCTVTRWIPLSLELDR